MALTKIGTDGVKDDAVTTDKLANAINTERTANTAKVSTTINNNADNRVITGSGTANTLNGESGLTYDSGGMSITGDSDRDGIKITQSGNNYGEFMFNSNRSSANNALGIIRSEWNSTEVASIYLTAGSDTTNKDDGQIKFMTSPDSGTGIQTRMTIDKDGNVGLGTTDPAEILHIKEGTNKNVHFTGGIGQIGNVTGLYAVNDANDTIVDIGMTGSTVRFGTTAGERGRFTGDGLCFNGDTAAANALDDYEEGTWSASLLSGGSSIGNQPNNNRYVKIGSMVYITGEISSLTSPDSNILEIGGLPFTIAQGREGTGSCMSHYVTYGTNRTMITLYIYDNSSKFRFYTGGNATSWRAITGSDFSTSGDIIFSFAYHTV